MSETSEDVIRLYLDDDAEPFKTARPPMRFQFSTMHLADGPHRLRIEAHNGLAGDSIREIPFHVRNGVAITVSGLEPNQEIAGQVGVIINAYAGNTEVDFEPSRAETPQPIPTWAWLIFLVIVAFTMFYVLVPNPRPPAASAAEINERVGERVFLDSCAKCHGEDGHGIKGYPPPPLKDNERALDPDPTELVTFVAAGPPPPPDASLPGPDNIGSGHPRVKMPAWGRRLTNAEFVAVLNHLRSHWGNQAPLILPTAKRPPKAISELDARLSKALQSPDYPMIAASYSQNTERPVRLVRDGGVDYSDNAGVAKAIRNWLTTGVKNVLSVQAQDAAYYVFEGGDLVYGHGTLVVTVNEKPGVPAKTYSGPFIRMYVNEPVDADGNFNPKPNPDPTKQLKAWRIAFDFARVPMPTGCEPGSTLAPGGCPAELGARLTYADVQRMLESLGQSAPNAPHGNFWKLPYEQFVSLKFPYKDEPGGTILLLNDKEDGVGGWDTNLLKALRDGKDILVHVPGKKEPVHRDIAPMPKGSPTRLSQNDLVYIEAWINFGKKKELDSAALPQDPLGPGMKDPGMDPPAMGDGAGDWKDDDVDFAGVLAIIESIKPKGASSAPHGKFWSLPYDEFVAKEFDIGEGTVKLLVKGKGADSNLIHAFKGEPLDVKTSSGAMEKHTLEMQIMPPSGKGAKVSAADIERIRRWIDHGAPEKKPGK